MSNSFLDIRIRSQYTRVYVPGGRAAHLLAPDISPNNRAAHAVCGVSNWPSWFLGTGSQDEHDEARQRPLCRNCGRRIAERLGDES